MAHDTTENWREKYATSELQAEFFSLKFSDIPRSQILELRGQFDKFDSKQCGELQEDEALRLMEHRKMAKTVVELRKDLEIIDVDKNRKLSFLELACAVFKKSWKLLHAPSHDPAQVEMLSQLTSNLAQFKLDAEARASMMAEQEGKLKVLAQTAAEKRAAAMKIVSEVEAEIKKLHDEEEKRKLDEEAHRQAAVSAGGAKGKKAMFEHAAADTKDTTTQHAEVIKREAAFRKKMTELNTTLKKAEDEAKQAEEEFNRITEEKKRAEEDAVRLSREQKDADEKRILAEKARKEKDAYEVSKAHEESEAKRKKEEDEKKKAESRAKLAAKAAAFK